MAELDEPKPTPLARFVAARREYQALAGVDQMSDAAAADLPGAVVSAGHYPMEIIEVHLADMPLPGGFQVDSASLKAYGYGTQDDDNRTWVIEIDAKTSLRIPAIGGAVQARASLLLVGGGNETSFRRVGPVVFLEFSVANAGVQMEGVAAFTHPCKRGDAMVARASGAVGGLAGDAVVNFDGRYECGANWGVVANLVGSVDGDIDFDLFKVTDVSLQVREKGREKKRGRDGESEGIVGG